jgi:hypothetical protein
MAVIMATEMVIPVDDTMREGLRPHRSMMLSPVKAKQSMMGAAEVSSGSPT